MNPVHLVWNGGGILVARFVVLARMLDEPYFDLGMLEQMIAIENGLTDPPLDDWFKLGPG